MFDTESVLISPEMLTLVAEIDEFRGAWRALGTLAPERLSALRRVATIESIGSVSYTHLDVYKRQGVGRSTIQAVVTASVLIIFVDFLLTQILLSLFPQL